MVGKGVCHVYSCCKIRRIALADCKQLSYPHGADHRRQRPNQPRRARRRRSACHPDGRRRLCRTARRHAVEDRAGLRAFRSGCSAEQQHFRPERHIPGLGALYPGAAASRHAGGHPVENLKALWRFAAGSHARQQRFGPEKHPSRHGAPHSGQIASRHRRKWIYRQFRPVRRPDRPQTRRIPDLFQSVRLPD